MKDTTNQDTTNHQDTDNHHTAAKRPMGERLARRWLRGLVYYPLVLLLALVLITIYVVESFGIRFWIAVASLLAVGLWMAGGIGRGSEPRTQADRAPWMTFIYMVVIAGAYGLLHQHQRDEHHRQSEAWQAEALSLYPDGMRSNAWQPIAVRAVIDEPLRYRRSTTPRSSRPGSSNRPDASDREGTSEDNASSQADLHWQTLTRVRIEQARRADGWGPSVAVASLVIDEKVRGYYPGDRVELYGHWRLPPEPSNPGQFDLRARYAELGWTAQLRVESSEQLLRIPTLSGVRLDRLLARMTDWSLATIERYVPFGQAPLTAALVLGQREQAHWGLQEELLATGTIHMLSISGMHIDMVAVALMVMGLMLRLPRAPTLIGIVLVCGLYAMLCGANPPVARAALMLTAACLARLLRWQLTSLNMLAGAALVLLVQRTSIAFEIGTQLSFMTVAVLILTFPILQHRQAPLRRLLESRQTGSQVVWAGAKRFVWESLRSSFWVCFLSAPLVWSNFHVLSPVAIVLNLVLWLPMLVALLSGLALILFGWLPPIAALLGIVCGAALWILTQCVAIAESLPLSHFWRAAPPSWWLVGFYALALGIVLWRGTRRTSARRLLWRSLAAWFALGLACEPISLWWRNTATQDGPGKLAVTWIDVGHGTCAAIETPNGEFWLYDAGRLGDHERSYQPIASALWHLGYSRIDRMLLSHADSDHYNAMPGIARRFRPREFVTTDSVLKAENPAIVDLLLKLERQSTRTTKWRQGDRYAGRGGWDIESLHPSLKQLDAPKLSDNAKSLCLAVRFAGRTILLPGDLEPPGTQALVAQPPIRCDVMMAPHHGSLAAQAEQVIAWTDAKWVVVSGSARAVTPRVLQAFTPPGGSLLITARDHALRVEIDAAGSLKILRWNNSNWEELHRETDKPPRG
jgi:competence protein ComEC